MVLQNQLCAWTSRIQKQY